MAKLKEITDFLDALLGVDKIPDDSSNNGLQVEGARRALPVRRVATGVSANLELFFGVAASSGYSLTLNFTNGCQAITGN